MLAAQYKEAIADAEDYSKIELVEVEKPSVAAGQALVKIYVASLNPIDWMVMAGMLQGMWDFPTPMTLGYDFSGVIEEIGADTKSDLAVGDAVFASNWGQGSHNTTPQIAGTFAQYIVIAIEKLSKKPVSVSHAQAAAAAMVGTTAYQTLEHAGVTKGTKVLVLGGASAVGGVAIQLAKARGAWVATTSSSRTKDYVENTLGGADLIVDYTKQNWEDVAELKGIDAVVDCVGDTNGFERAKTIVNSDGAFVSISSHDAGFDPKGHPPLSFAAFFCFKQNSKMQDEIIGMVEAGTLKVPVEQSFPFTQEGVVDIMKEQKKGKNKGKLVLTIV